MAARIMPGGPVSDADGRGPSEEDTSVSCRSDLAGGCRGPGRHLDLFRTAGDMAYADTLLTHA